MFRLRKLTKKKKKEYLEKISGKDILSDLHFFAEYFKLNISEILLLLLM